MQSQPLPLYAPVILKLLQGVIYNDDPHWTRLQSDLVPVRDYFSKIGLRVQNYETEGFAYLEQPEADSDEGIEVLPRLTVRHKLSFKTTIFCVLLREQLRQFDASDAIGRLVLKIEEIRDLLQPYLPEKNNEEKFRREVKNLVEQAVEFSFLKRLSGEDENYEVRPILKAKIDAEMLELLKQKLENHANKLTN